MVDTIGRQLVLIGYLAFVTSIYKIRQPRTGSAFFSRFGSD